MARSTARTNSSGRSESNVPKLFVLPALVRQCDVRTRAAIDWIRVGDQVEQQNTQAVDVGRSGSRSSFEDFWRQVQRRAGEIIVHKSAIGQVVPGQILSGSEVHQDRSPAVCPHHVMGFEVAVHQAGAVHGRQRAAQIQSDQRSFTRAERAVLAQQAPKRTALDEFHPETDAAIDIVGPVDGDDVGMPNSGEQPRFSERARRICGTVLLGWPQQLQRDFTLELVVPGSVHRAERTAADFLENGEVPPAPKLRGPDCGRAGGAAVLNGSEPRWKFAICSSSRISRRTCVS